MGSDERNDEQPYGAPLGSRWVGPGAVVIKVVEVDGDRVRLDYVDEPGAGEDWWEFVDDLVALYTRRPPMPWDAEFDSPSG
ncbi:MAG TPA: hypothetical protein VHD87_14840 [Acidimicrobiales bacterium]|nr:hypothetical protein [Acidimicrobiales bacterium]